MCVCVSVQPCVARLLLSSTVCLLCCCAAPLAAAPPEPWNVWNSATPAPNPALAAGLGTSPGMLPPSSIGIRWTGWKVDGGGGAGGEEG